MTKWKSLHGYGFLFPGIIVGSILLLAGVAVGLMAWGFWRLFNV